MSSELLTTSQMRDTINLIINLKNTKKLKELKKTSIDEYHLLLNKTFEKFKLFYPAIFDMIINNDESDELIYKMLDMKDKIENGGNKDSLEKELGEILAKKYIYPVVNK